MSWLELGLWIFAALWLFAVPGGVAVMVASGEDPRSVAALARGVGRGAKAYVFWLFAWAASFGFAAPALVWFVAG